MVIPSQVQVLDDKMEKLKRERESAFTHRERKHEDWNDNYELYRNKVRTNRLTQRQTVNIPMMKETVKTILSKIDDPPQVKWRERAGDMMKELIFQEMWEETSRKQKFDWIDVLDKKNVLLYGLSTKKLNPRKGEIDISVLDVFDIAFDPTMNPLDVESARFIVQSNIFRSLREILADKKYSEAGKEKLKIWADSPDGVIQSQQNKEEYAKRMERLRGFGVQDSDFPLYAGGDIVVNLTEHYTQIWNTEAEKFERHVVVYADQWCELLDEPLKKLIGIDEYPFVVWYEDPETNDVYPDGIADLVRTPNKVVNVWFSQLIENRTLRNFTMHWYDASNDGYTPQTYEPGPGRMLPAPGNPRDTIMPVELSGLDETLTAIDFVTRIVERGSGAVAIDKGVGEQKEQTLGEVEILVGKAMERSVAMQKFYRGSWYELSVKWCKLMHANPPGRTSLFKIGKSGKLYEKIVYSKDWSSEAGYEPLVTSSSEQEENSLKSIQKFSYVQQQSPNNKALRRISQKRQLEILDLTPAELKEIEDGEKEAEAQEKMLMQQQIAAQTPQGNAQTTGQQGGVQNRDMGDPEMQGLMQELATL